MPKSKHRKLKNGKRPARKFKGNVSQIYLPKESIKKLNDVFEEVDFIAETKFALGDCDYSDVAAMRDVLNFCSWAATYLRSKNILSEEWMDVSWPKFNECQAAFHTFYQRGLAAGGLITPEKKCWVATGEESVKIRDGILIANHLCQTMINTTPQHFLRLFNAMKDFLSGRGPGRLEFDPDDLELKINKILHGC